MSDTRSDHAASVPMVSVGIPTYNRPEGLRRALECVTGQTYRNLEIIVSDNASRGDETENVVRGFIRNDPRVQYVRQPENIGAIHNLQFVLNKAKGKYFLWHADDDLCEPEFITELVSCLEQHPDIVLAMTDVKVIAGDDSVIRVEHLDSIRVDRTSAESFKERGLFFRYPTSNIFFCIYGLYCTDIVRASNLNTRTWRGYLFCSEVPFLAQIAAKGRIASVPGMLKLYRSHLDSYYMKELPAVTLFDRLMRGAEIRLQLIRITLASELDWQTKCSLLSNVVRSWIRSTAGTAYRLMARVARFPAQNPSHSKNEVPR